MIEEESDSSDKTFPLQAGQHLYDVKFKELDFNKKYKVILSVQYYNSNRQIVAAMIEGLLKHNYLLV